MTAAAPGKTDCIANLVLIMLDQRPAGGRICLGRVQGRELGSWICLQLVDNQLIVIWVCSAAEYCATCGFCVLAIATMVTTVPMFPGATFWCAGGSASGGCM